MRTGWAALVAAMLLPPGPAAAAGLDELIGQEFSVAVVAIDGDTLLVVGHRRDYLPGAEVTALDLIVRASLKPGRANIRLWGISAPEADAPGGWQAAGALDALLAQRPVGPIPSVYWATCRGVDVHRAMGGDARLVARCESGLSSATRGGDLGAAMIYGGWATADRLYTWGAEDPELQAEAPTYDAMQRAAREARRGLWALPGM